MENNFNNPIKTKEKPEQITFPHAEYGLKLYEKEYGNNPEEIKRVKEIFDTFLNQEIENIKIYNSEKFGVSLPYTSINAGDFAKKFYEKYTGEKAEIKTPKESLVVEGNKKHISNEYMFPGAPLNMELLDNGPFHYVGESMRQCIEKLPAALEKIKNGEEPDEFEVFTMGTPINELGKMSPGFLEIFKKNPTGVMSEVFAEFIKKNSETKYNMGKLDIELFGISWGGGVASIAGEKLLETGEFTQDSEESEEKGIPKIAIKAQNPVSLSRSKIKGPQIWFGSPLNDPVSGDQYGPTMGKENPEFAKQINKILEKRGIYANKSEEQQKMKKKAMLDIILSFRKGLKLKPETKITEIYGLHDLTTKTSSLTKEVKEQMKSHPDSLGQNLAKPQRENSRVFGADMFHEFPWFRETELRKIKKAAEKLEELEKSK